MGYTETVLTVTNALLTLIGVLVAHFAVFALIGIFRKKTYPETPEKLRYGILIPARNEEAVVASLIKSIRRSDYPQEKLQIFVIAHNCTDRTAEIARAAGATVYEYENPDECTKGYAIRHLFSKIEEDYGTQSFDGFFLLDVDNALDRSFISRMNDAFVACGRKNVVTAYRNSKNFGQNLISGLYGVYFATGCLLDSRGRTAAGCATRVQGTGYLVPPELVKDGWQYVTLTEDWELTADCVLHGRKIYYCDDAVFYDEQPTTLRIMWRQRVRWARGHLMVFYSHFAAHVKALLRPNVKNRGSLYDITVYILPLVHISTAIMLLQVLLLLFAPLTDEACTLYGVFIESGYLLGMLKSWAISYAGTLLSAIVVFILARGRIRGVSLPRKIAIALTWPLFLAVQLPISIQALFSKNLGWKPIPHSDCTSFDDLNA